MEPFDELAEALRRRLIDRARRGRGGRHRPQTALANPDGKPSAVGRANMDREHGGPDLMHGYPRDGWLSRPARTP